MPIITVENVECPYCGDVADVEIDDTLTTPQFDECDECEEEFQIIWDPIAKTATVEGLLEEDDDEDLTALVESEFDEMEDDDLDETE